MRLLSVVAGLAVLATAGCAHNKPTGPPGNFTDFQVRTNTLDRQNLTITQQPLLVGKVVSVNVTGRFAIVNFPLGRMPASGQRFSAYRQGLKMGEVRITGPQRDDNIVADITVGDVTVGDEIREK